MSMIKIGKVMGDVLEAGAVKNVTNNYYGEEKRPEEGKNCVVGDEQAAARERGIIEKLLPVFKHNEAAAREFLQFARGNEGPKITQRVTQLVEAGTIDAKYAKRTLHGILHENGIYHQSEQNWNSQVKIKY